MSTFENLSLIKEDAMAKKKEKTYICVVCDKTKKSSKKVKCCSKDMVSRERGTWNA